MRKLFLMILVCSLGWNLGCGEPPAPVGPAAEAITADIEISMDVPVTSESSTEATTPTGAD